MPKKPPTFAALRREYADLWANMRVDPANRDLFDSVARRLYKNVARYREIEKATGVPATFIMVAHERESAGNFKTYLGNGQPLNKKTTIVPKGRGPFASFEEGAIDALEYQGLTGITDWSLERMLYELEAYNGWGYRLYHPEVKSPYLWSRTSIYDRGKYTSDGKFNAAVKDQQTGCAGIISALWAIDPTLRVGVQAYPPPPVILPVPHIPPPRMPPDVETPDPPRSAGFLVRVWNFLTTGVWK